MTDKSPRRANTPKDPLAAAISEAEAKVTAGKQNLAHLRQQFAAAETALSDADDAGTIGVLAARVADLQKAVSTAVVEVQRLRAAVPNTDISLAAALVPLVSDLLGGVPVIASAVKPDEAPAHAPVAVVVQTRPSTLDIYSGSISGEVTCYFYRHGVHKSMDAKAFHNLAEGRQIRLTASARGDCCRVG